MADHGECAAPAISFGDGGKVFMRLFPGTDLQVEVSRAAALHLFALVCRAMATAGQKSWSGFWPRIEQIERTMTVLFMDANGGFCKKLPMRLLIDEGDWWSDRGEDFRNVAHAKRRKPLSPEARAELEALYRIHLEASLPKPKVLEIWKEENPAIYGLFERLGILDGLCDGGVCYDYKRLYPMVRDALLAHGKDVVQKGPEMTFEEWCANDASIFAGSVRLPL